MDNAALRRHRKVIERECRRAYHDFIAGAYEGPYDVLDNAVHSDAGDHIELHAAVAVIFGKRSYKGVGGLVGIAVAAAQRLLCGIDRGIRGSERVFVACKSCGIGKTGIARNVCGFRREYVAAAFKDLSYL